MNIDQELTDLADLLGQLEASCDRLAALADHMSPGQFRASLLGIGTAMRGYREFIAVIQDLAETPDP